MWKRFAPRCINVVGALNLQHIREQQDTVERITGKRAESSVPQSFIESADEIVIVDVPTEDLKGGKLTLLNPVQLSELREAALLLAAEVVEHQLQRYMDSHGILQSWGTQERILVCVTAQNLARTMLESGARAEARFHGQLLAVTVRMRTEMPRAVEEALAENLEYARGGWARKCMCSRVRTRWRRLSASRASSALRRSSWGIPGRVRGNSGNQARWTG